MKKLAKLFIVFAQLGVCTFGGGYAMLSLLQRVVVGQYKWATDEELMDYYAIGQCTPGIIAINTSTFIGYKLYGLFGAIAATLGFLFPSIIIIIAIAAFLTNFADLPIVAHAFGGIRVAVCMLILDAVLKLGKKAITSWISWAIFGIVLVLAAFVKVPTVALVLGSGIAGYIIYVLVPTMKKGGNKA